MNTLQPDDRIKGAVRLWSETRFIVYYRKTQILRRKKGEHVLDGAGWRRYWTRKTGQEVDVQDFTSEELTVSYFDPSLLVNPSFHSLSMTIMFACERIHLILGVFFRSLRSGSLEARHSYVPVSSRLRLRRWMVLAACAMYVAFIWTRSLLAPSNSWVNVSLDSSPSTNHHCSSGMGFPITSQCSSTLSSISFIWERGDFIKPAECNYPVQQINEKKYDCVLGAKKNECMIDDRNVVMKGRKKKDIQRKRQKVNKNQRNENMTASKTCIYRSEKDVHQIVILRNILIILRTLIN